MTEHTLTVDNDKNHIRINKPEHDDTVINLSINTDKNITVSIDFYHEVPVLYVYNHIEDEPQHVIRLPTATDPKTKLLNPEKPVTTQLDTTESA